MDIQWTAANKEFYLTGIKYNNKMFVMKIYVAGKLESRERIKETYNKLIEKGHKISYNWTKHKQIKPYEKNQVLANKYSSNELSGLQNCDVFILFSEREGGTGMHIEFGVALILNKLFNKPKIYVVGHANNRSTFYFQETVKRVDTLEDVLKEL